jgi:hypothetical protein
LERLGQELRLKGRRALPYLVSKQERLLVTHPVVTALGE